MPLLFERDSVVVVTGHPMLVIEKQSTLTPHVTNLPTNGLCII